MDSIGFEHWGGFPLMSCTLCWATISLHRMEEHTRWHEHVERVPAITTDYPPSVVIPKDKD